MKPGCWSWAGWMHFGLSWEAVEVRGCVITVGMVGQRVAFVRVTKLKGGHRGSVDPRRPLEGSGREETRPAG